MTKRTPGPIAEDLLDRMGRKFTVGDGCWEWTAGVDRGGYGNIQVRQPDGKWQPRKAHRLLYELLVGPIPEGLTLDHLCRNRRCVRPAHLEPVTRAENVLRGVAASAVNARKTHCLNGHPFDESNTRIVRAPSGGPGRACRACEHTRRRKAPEKETG